MKRIKEAYRKGQGGEDLRDDRAGRLRKFAHNLGAASARSMAKENEAMDRYESAHFHKALEASRGANRTAMEILQAAARIPHQSSSKPLWGVGEYPEGARLADNPKIVAKQWDASFVHVPSTTQESRHAFATPVVQNLGSLKIDDMYWGAKQWFFRQDSLTPADSVRVPVDNISITVRAAVDGQVGPATTQVWINSREYHAGNPDASKQERKRDYEREFGEKVSFTLNEEGELIDLRVSTPNVAGMVDLDVSKAKVDVEAFFQGVLSSVNETAAAYEALQQDM